MLVPWLRLRAVVLLKVEAVPLGHFMQLALAVTQVLVRIQDWVITSQKYPALHKQARFVPEA
jgi:hypothetical protein